MITASSLVLVRSYIPYVQFINLDNRRVLTSYKYYVEKLDSLVVSSLDKDDQIISSVECFYMRHFIVPYYIDLLNTLLVEGYIDHKSYHYLKNGFITFDDNTGGLVLCAPGEIYD